MHLIEIPYNYEKINSNSKYLLQTNYNNKDYLWETDCNVRTAVGITEKEVYIFTLELKPFTIIDNKLKRMVLIEKSGCKKTLEILEDPLKIWSTLTMFSSSFYDLKKDFILFHIKNNKTIKTFFLNRCILTDTTEWSFNSNNLRCSEKKFKISIVPETILQVP